MTSHSRQRRTHFPIGLMLGLVLAGCSSGGGRVQADERVSVSGIEVTVPAGWSYGETGEGVLVVANGASDIEADVPSGPRLTVSATGAALPAPAELFAASREEQATIRGEPEQLTVDGRPAVAIEAAAVRQGAPVVSKVIAVSGEPGGYTITEEAPEAQWDSSRAQLDEIEASIRFGGGGSAGVVTLLVILVALVGATAGFLLLRRRGRAAATAPSTEAIPADWYPDPSGEARLRYWDGSDWTEHTAD